ncbi:MAG: hypothetical protein EPO40_28000 [Myxococcaceae bacterium]|nr:MAG: hypothetical protein EPO40_28000 [Myxococcaceae bacterium]
MRHGRTRRRAGRVAGSGGVVGTLLVALLVVGAAGCGRTRARPTDAPVTALDPSYGALRADFVRDAGHPRLLVVVSPT